MKLLGLAKSSFRLPILLSIIVAGLVLLPIVNLVVSSFTTVRLGARTEITLSNYYAAYAEPRFIPTLVNSIVYAGGSTILGLSIAIALAWIVARTNTPLKGATQLMTVFPLLMPPMMDNIAWIFLLAPRAGILNKFLSETFGIQSGLSAFSLPAMIWVYGLSLVPLMYLMVLPAFLMMDPSLEEAATISGASLPRTFATVTLPLLLPAVLSAAIVGFLHGLRSFETPTLQGIPAGIPVFVSLVYEAAELEFNYGLAVAYSILLLLITLTLVWLYVRVTKMGQKYSAVSGRGMKPKLVHLGKWRFVTLAFVLSYFAIAVILPFIVVIITSLIPTFTYDFFKGFISHMTSDNYTTVLRQPAFINGLVNGLLIGLATASIVMISSATMSHLVHRSQTPGRKIFEAIGTIPLAFPGLVLSFGLLLAYIGTPLYNTALAILASFIIFNLPYGLRITSGALLRIHKEMDEAAVVHGASWRAAFTKITLPLARPALVSGFFYIFLAAYREVGAAVLLTGPGVSYGAVTLFEYYRLGQWAETAAGSVIYAGLLVTFLLVAKYVSKIRLTKSFVAVDG